MCKVLIMPKVNGPKAIEFAKRMGEKMSLSNNDGLGYAAVDKEGNLFSEKWLHNHEAFKTSSDVPSVLDPMDQIKSVLSSFKSRTNKGLSGEVAVHGTPDINNAVSLTLHTRMATSAKGLMNAHPFISSKYDTSLIHNGVIRNEEDFKFELSTCDSEAILISYLKQKVNLDASKVQEMADMLTGYYACGVFSRDRQGTRILDIFKGNSASLYSMHIPDLDTIIFTTSSIDAENVCREMGLARGESFSVNEGHLIRFDVLNNSVMSITDFKVGLGYKSYDNNNYNRNNYTQPSTTKMNLSSDMIAMMRSTPKLEELSPFAVKTFLSENKLSQVYS